LEKATYKHWPPFHVPYVEQVADVLENVESESRGGEKEPPSKKRKLPNGKEDVAKKELTRDDVIDRIWRSVVSSVRFDLADHDFTRSFGFYSSRMHRKYLQQENALSIASV
jgi:hypothetical protein